jgi:hypothetical protein
VRTLYLETCHFNCPRALHRPQRMAGLLRAAHARGIRVVAWYLPGFARPKQDLQRSMAAIRFRTRDGHRFDGFALDIEAVEVPTGLRNHRLKALSEAIRHQVGAAYGLGAITPPWFYAWGPFPYRALARQYDVFMPMNYFTVRAEGPGDARIHTRRSIRAIRRGTGDPSFPVHDIGGWPRTSSRARYERWSAPIAARGPSASACTTRRPPTLRAGAACSPSSADSRATSR